MDQFCTMAAVSELSQRAEAAGYFGVFVTDHPSPPAAFVDNGGHHALEPTVALAVAGAATTTLRLMTNLYIIGYRNPFLAAKAIASLDAMAEGRVILGTGAGYLEAEFAALGGDFEQRNDVLDERLRIMKEVWTGAPVTESGPGYVADAIVALPTPHQRPNPPIWVGGNSKRAMRRTVEFGDGWMPIPASKGMAAVVRTASIATIDDLGERLSYLHEHAAKVGRTDPVTVTMSPWNSGRYGTDGFSVEAFIDEAGRLAELGVEQVPINFAFPGKGGLTSREQFLDLADGFASDIVSQFR